MGYQFGMSSWLARFLGSHFGMSINIAEGDDDEDDEYGKDGDIPDDDDEYAVGVDGVDELLDEVNN